MPQLAIGALAFLRGDVQAAQEMVALHLPHTLVLDGLRGQAPTDQHPYPLPWTPGRLALIHQTAIADFRSETPQPGPESSPEGTLQSVPSSLIVSDTDELVWMDEPDSGCVLVDTPCFQAVIGHTTGAYAVTNLVVELETPFAAVQVASLDGRPIADSARLLLVTGARVANTGMRWADETRRSLGDAWGSGPTRIEPVLGSVGLRGLSAAEHVSLQPLDPAGQPQGDPLPFQPSSQGTSVSLPGTTPWYVIDVMRGISAGAMTGHVGSIVRKRAVVFVPVHPAQTVGFIAQGFNRGILHIHT